MLLTVQHSDVTADTLQAAATLVRAIHMSAGLDSRLDHAILRAQRYLLRYQWGVSGGILRVQSSKGTGYYHADADHCDCKARGWCWHRASWLLLSAIASVAHVKPKRQYTDADYDALYA